MLVLAAVVLLTGEPAAVDTIVVDTRSDASGELRDEIRLRLGRREIAWAQAGMQTPEGSSIWVILASTREGAVKLQFIVSDRRAYSRTVDAVGDDAARAIASAIANTVAAIEAGSVEPEATGVPLPEPPQEATAPEPTPTPVAAPAVQPQPVAPPPVLEPVAWIGVGLGGVIAFGVGPPNDLQGVVGGGGLGQLRFLHRTGATAALQLRGLALARDDVVLSRLRVAVTAGYAWQRSRFDLVTEAGVTVEPVWTGSFDLAPPLGGPRTPAPLVGGRLAVSPGYLVWSRDRTALRVGLELDLAQSVEARTPAGAVQILRASDEGLEPFMRAGGFELAIALGAELRFAAGRARPRYIKDR
jgi:hypothetical protein